MSGFHTVVVGVEHLAPVRALWRDLFGFEERTLTPGRIGALAARWGIDRGHVSDALQLRTPGQDQGQLLFVEFAGPAVSVRAGAAPTDLCPKNLDLYVDDLPARLPDLLAGGARPRQAMPNELTAPNGMRFRELHLQGHDDLNIVLLQLLDPPADRLPAFSPKGFAGVGAMVTTVRDAASEVSFHRDRNGFVRHAQHRFAGPEIEDMVGLPPGAALDITILGGDGLLGQLEIVSYGNAAGKDRYPLTRPPARGILEVELGPPERLGQLELSPAGLRTWQAMTPSEGRESERGARTR